MSNLAEHFSEYFSLQFANTKALKQKAFQIRYQVYCEEFQYQVRENCPEGLEQDADDDRSLHFLLQHKASNSSVACVRLVLPTPPSPSNILPFEKAVPKGIEMSWQPQLRDNYGEISRLAVISQFRRRQGEDSSPMGDLLSVADLRNSYYDLEQRRFPIIALSLYLTPIAIALELGIDLVVVMKPRLARNLRSIGIVSHCLSNLFDYHGKQGLFLIKPTEIFQFADSNIQDLLILINERVVKSISAARWQELHQQLANTSSPKLSLAS
jgi:N-acyl amino acid synthase of PEP-CTERM/exosortase system